MREKLHRTKWAPDRAKHQGKDWPSFLTGMVLSSTHPALPSPTTVAWRLNSRAWTSATVARNLVAIDWDQPSALSSHRGSHSTRGRLQYSGAQPTSSRQRACQSWRLMTSFVSFAVGAFVATVRGACTVVVLAAALEHLLRNAPRQPGCLPENALLAIGVLTLPVPPRSAASRNFHRKCLIADAPVYNLRSTGRRRATRIPRHAPCSEGLFFWPRLHALRPHCGRGPKSSRHCTRRLQHQTRGRGGEESY